MSVFVLIDHDRGVTTELALQSVSLGRDLADQLSTQLEAVVIGFGADQVSLGESVDVTWRIQHELLSDYAADGWAQTLVQLISAENPKAVVSAGSERGNEVLAHAAAITDLPMAANVTTVTVEEDSWRIERVRWGGSLLEEAVLTASVPLVSAAPFAFAPADITGSQNVVEFKPNLDQDHVIGRVFDRTTLVDGTTLATAPVVVSGGRGVGGPDGFGALEELAGLLGGAVGCTRVVTNNGWRPHSDQVGQTGTRVAPDVYIACGISGAIQHWVGMKSAKHVLAINIDPEAPMVSKADYALIGDVSEVVPAVVAEIRKRAESANRA